MTATNLKRSAKTTTHDHRELTIGVFFLQVVGDYF